MYQCLASNFEKFNKKIQAVVKQINKYGYCAEYKVLGEEIKKVPVYVIDGTVKTKINTVPVKVVNYDFYMPDFKVGNYTPVAVIEHDVVENSDVKNMVHVLAKDFNVPKEWWTIGGHCDDCNDKYLRKKTVMLQDKDNGSFRQIGTSCLKKYLGITCFNVIHNFMTVSELVEEEVYVDYDYICRENKYAETECLLAYVIDVYKQFDGNYVKDETIKLAFNNYLDDKELSDDSKVMSAEIIKFFNELSVENLDNFQINVRNAVLTKYIGRSGLLAYAPVVYERLKNVQESKKQDELSEYLGNKGEKITVDVVVTRHLCFDTQYGYSYMNIFKQVGTNNVLIWTTTTKSYETGVHLKVMGTIKDHREYNGVKQTVLTRVKEI